MTQVRRLSSEALRRARLDYITEESVYGTVLVSGMIVVAGSYGATSWEVFLSVFGTVVVFWAAHVYAGTIAGHGAFEGDDSSLGTAFRRALRRSVGFLTSALPPSVVLLLGATQTVDDKVAIWVALWLGVVILGHPGLHRVQPARRFLADPDPRCAGHRGVRCRDDHPQGAHPLNDMRSLG